MVKFGAKLLLTALGILTVFHIYAAGEINVKAAVSPEHAAVGQEITYTVAYEKTGAVSRVEIPEKKKYMDDKAPEGSTKALVPLFEITDILKEENADSMEVKYTFKILYFRTGTYTLPEVLIYDSQNIAAGYKLPQVEIQPVTKDDKILPDEPPLDLKGNYTRLILLILSVAAAAVILTLLALFIVKKLKERKIPEAVIPPIEIFRKEIAELESRSYIATGEKELYCIEVSQIFKRFISSSLGIDAVEMTSEEFIAAVGSNINVNDERDGKIILGKIQEMTGLWDLSKFAEFDPSPEVLEANLRLTGEAAEKIIWESGNVRFGV